MASIVLSSIGASVGNDLLPGIGGSVLGSFARKAGKWLDSQIGISGGSNKEGSRLESLKVQDSRYGVGIPVVFGRVRVAGNIIWISDLIEASHENAVSGGKGGITSAFSSTSTSYSYSLHCAIAVAAGEIGGIETIWADSKIIYQNGVWKSGVVGNASLYTGMVTQEPDPLMESFLGSGKVPAYRGTAYIVLESFQLADFGNRLPNITFEVLPKGVAIAPKWLGSVDAQINSKAVTVCNNGMMPLVVEGSIMRARRMIVGGYNFTGSIVKFSVAEYDVTGDAPVEMARVSSATFTANSVGEQSWAMAPDGRFVACCLQNIGSSPTHRLAIYDSESHVFGDVFSVDLAYGSATKQVAWIDDLHFVISDVSGDRRGLRVFARAGLSIVDLGFYDVWGAGSASSRVPLFYAQFTPFAGGLLHYVADFTPNFTAIYVRSVVWQNNALVVGSQYTLTSGYNTGTGSGAQACFVKTGENAWTLFYGTVVDMRMMSFEPSTVSATVTRPWQTLTNSSFSVGTSTHPIVYGDRIVVMQRSSADNYYRISEIALGDGSFLLTTDGAIVEGFASPVVDFGGVAIDGTRLLLIGLNGFYNNMGQVAIIRRRNTGNTLDHIVADILERAGYAEGDYDVSALESVEVDGYVLTDSMQADSALAPLQVYEPFDLVESDGKLKAVLHGNTADVVIATGENRATDKVEGEPQPSRLTTRTQELDLPVEVNIDYLDASRDYEAGSQRARRSATRGAKSVAKIDLPIVCTASKAKQVAEARLFTAWAERDVVKMSWSRKWLAVEPGDIVDLGDRLMRVAKVTRKGGLLNAQGPLVPSTICVYAAEADSGLAVDHADIQLGATTVYLMDLPLLRAADDQAGIYVAVGANEGWTAGSLWRSADDVNFSSVASFDTAATSGIAVTKLADRSCCFMDRASVADVQVMRGTLASCTEVELLGGANVARLGGEIIQFQTAELVGPGLYRLSNFLRGRRGTEEATSTHSVGEAFVLLTEGTVKFVPALLSDRGRTYYFRGLTKGQTLGEGVDLAVAYGLNTLKPLAPVHLAGSRSGGNLTISWKRRARMNGDWVDFVDVPLDEPVELYDVEILDGSTVMRTVSGVTTNSVVYTAAQQTADWGGSIPSTFTVKVYQISSRYGRGVSATGSV